MHAKDPSIDDSSQTQIIEYIAAIPPDVCAPKLALTLVVETVDLGDLSRFVIAPD